ncbi:MAG: hypothetical protein IJ740_05660 [Ruminococcus sp.]|nr:hypothetical protein [Ruminococcus sp.]
MRKITQQQIDSLAASFYPTIKAYFESEQGRAEYQKYLEEKAGNAKPADKTTADKNGNVA